MSSRAGVSQVLNRYTYSSTLSHLRRTNTPIGRDGKIAKPRQLQYSLGLVCPAETQKVKRGLVKNLSLMTCISVGTPSEPILGFLRDYGLEVLKIMFHQMLQIQLECLSMVFGLVFIEIQQHWLISCVN